MKRWVSFILIAVLCLCITACNSVDNNEDNHVSQPNTESITVPESTPEPPAQPSEESSDAPTEEPTTEPEAQEGKTLVVFYSATGNTKEVAGFIAAATGGDTFELVPVEPYTSADLDWTNQNSRVSREHDNPDKRFVELVESTAPDWASYDTVFIGYPIWWGIAAWPVDSFIDANDFAVKTITQAMAMRHSI